MYEAQTVFSRISSIKRSERARGKNREEVSEWKYSPSPQGSLDNDNVARATLMYRNTPIQDIGLLQAQFLLHYRICDSIPSQPILYKQHTTWVAAAQRREEILHPRNAKMLERYNRYTHKIRPLPAGYTVDIQSSLSRL